MGIAKVYTKLVDIKTMFYMKVRHKMVTYFRNLNDLLIQAIQTMLNSSYTQHLQICLYNGRGPELPSTDDDWENISKMENDTPV